VPWLVKVPTNRDLLQIHSHIFLYFCCLIASNTRWEDSGFVCFVHVIT
jgi:hypothetical protein